MSEISTAHRAPARMSLLFANADFWRLWYAGLIVFVVRWLETLAVAVFVYRATGSPFLVAMMTMLRLLPMGLFGAVFGAVAERIERRTAQLGVIALMGGTSASLAVLAYGGQLAVWQLAVASFINGLGWATDNPVRRVMIGEVVGSQQMGIAMSISKPRLLPTRKSVRFQPLSWRPTNDPQITSDPRTVGNLVPTIQFATTEAWQL